MAKFISKKTFSLSFLGEEWKDCFIKFSSTSINESKKLINMKLGDKSPQEITDLSIKLLSDHFLEGVAFDDETKQIVPLEKKDLWNMPSEVQERAVLFLVGGATQ